MKRIEKVHLYVEKYNRLKQELLLDFVKEDEFLYFKNYGDYMPDMHLSMYEYEPTMLLVYECSPKRELKHGAILTLDMAEFMKMRNERDISLFNETVDLPATVFLEIKNGASFAELIDNADDCSVSMRISEDYIVRFDSSWNNRPCALSGLSENFNIIVWDVGQGNTNCISDEHNLTIFDFGSSIYYSKEKQKTIVNEHIDFINMHDRISLVISHWDIDHYNLLCSVSDDYLSNICCIFYPPQGIGVTLMQIKTRIEKICRYRNAINSPKKISRTCGLRMVFSGYRYKLFTGEKSQSKNHSGLILMVFNNNSATFLTADHSNYQVWNQLYQYLSPGINILHVVVPHHGGNCGNTPIPRRYRTGLAVISVGSNTYGHPMPKTISTYQNAGYTIKRTDRCGQDIVIEM